MHDLRRSAARNLRNAGVPEGVIMKIGGWKTRSVFDRYSIIVQSDIPDAVEKLEQARIENQQARCQAVGAQLVRNSGQNEDSDNLTEQLSSNKIN
ncbi:MAG: hypothetical protein ABSF85_16795 [Terriglobales bacterium]